MYELRIVRVFVRDFAKSLAFYSETLGMAIAISDPEAGWAELETGAAHLALEQVAPGDDEGAELVGRFVGVSLAVDDVEANYRKLVARGVEFAGAPERQAWGGMLAHFRDPDGNILTLLSA